jgi:hypothetical protein
MKHPNKIVISFAFLSVLCCVLMYLFWDGYYLPGKSCRPITYPDARRTTKTFFLVTSDPIDKVLQFYNQQLDAQPLYLADTGDWKQEQLSNTKYLFSCYGNDINLLTTESNVEHKYVLTTYRLIWEVFLILQYYVLDIQNYLRLIVVS